MKIKAIVDGVEKWVELPKESVDAIRNGDFPITGYEKGKDSEFMFFVSGTGSVESSRVGALPIGHKETYYRCGNYYTSKTIAENNARADELMRRMRRFAAFNGGVSRCDNEGDHWEIYYNHQDKKLKADECYGGCQTLFSIYFASEYHALKAIEEFRDDLMWYFTQYIPMLHEG